MAINDIDFIKTTSGKIGEVCVSYPASIIHTHDDNGDDNLYIGDTRITDNFNIGDMDENLQTNKVGGLEATTLGRLKDKSMSQIIIDMICPLTYPTHTSPYINISYSNTLIKVGTVLPEMTDISVSTNSGVWSDGSAYYGSCGDVVLTMNPDKWGEASEEGIYTISGTGEFASGDMSKDSHGNDYQQASGGSVTSNTISIKSVYPISINDSDITTMSERIIDYNSLQTLYVDIPAEVDGTLDKFKVYLPSVFSTFEVKQYNTISGKYDIDVNMVLMEGTTSNYIRTNDTHSTITGTAKYEIKLKK